MTVVKFHYTGQAQDEIPRNMTHLIIDASVREIPEDAFQDCRVLVDVEIREGLLVIGECAFCNCRSLQFVNFPSTLREIENDSFLNCYSVSTYNK